MSQLKRPAKKHPRQTSLTDSSLSSQPQKKRRKDYHILCDLDGVLADFNAGVEQLCGKRPHELTPRVLWKKIFGRRKAFFEHLPWTHDGERLWQAIRPLRPDILTGVPRGKAAQDQKYAWCKRELGVETNHLDLAAPKKRHDYVKGYRRDDAVNVITCHTRNKHMESGPGR